MGGCGGRVTTNQFCHPEAQIQPQQIPAGRPHVSVGGRCQSGRKSSDRRKIPQEISPHTTLQEINRKVSSQVHIYHFLINLSSH